MAALSRSVFLKLLALPALALGVATSSLAQQSTGPKPVIQTQDDLPRHRYPLDGTAADMLQADDETFNAFAGKVAGDADAVLTGYALADRATQRRLLTTRSFFEMLTGRNEQALDTILAIRALEEKPDARMVSGLREEAVLRARIATGKDAGPDFDSSFAQIYGNALEALPFDIVGVRLKEMKGKIVIQSPARVGGYIANEVEPVVKSDHAVMDKGADDILWARSYYRVMAPTSAASIAVLDKVITANAVTKPDIFTPRDLTLTAADRARPVVLAVWDSGVDVSLFPDRVYRAETPARPPYNGHGLSFDVNSRPSSGVLRPLSREQQLEFSALVSDLQGFADNQAAVDSPAADALHTKLADMSAEQSAAYMEAFSFYGDYLHGTHVAGIAARGNPYVRLAVIRDTYDTRSVPAPPTDASVARRVALYDRVSVWLKDNKVRIVNMSWSDGPEGYETDLEKNGVGKNVAERKALARRFFERARDAFERLIKDNPDTLFVAAAGNANEDTGFAEAYPAALVAPNLLVVSAVDQAGDEVGFTSTGKNVSVSANGYLVTSYVPGGAELAESGTSMASPNVANLAGKLIALRPDLTAEQVAKLIVESAVVSGDGRRRNIDPTAALALLKSLPPPERR